MCIVAMREKVRSGVVWWVKTLRGVYQKRSLNTKPAKIKRSIYKYMYIFTVHVKPTGLRVRD